MGVMFGELAKTTLLWLKAPRWISKVTQMVPLENKLGANCNGQTADGAGAERQVPVGLMVRRGGGCGKSMP